MTKVVSFFIVLVYGTQCLRGFAGDYMSCPRLSCPY